MSMSVPGIPITARDLLQRVLILYQASDVFAELDIHSIVMEEHAEVTSPLISL